MALLFVPKYDIIEAKQRKGVLQKLKIINIFSHQKNHTMDRVFRVFISSVGTMLKEERQEIIDEVLHSNNLPIHMARFVGPNKDSIQVVKKYLDMCDVVVFVIGHLYGKIVKLKKNDCPIKDFCNKCTGDCIISYTHFEYLYAKHHNKVCYCFVLDKYADKEVFEKNLKKKVKKVHEKESITKDFSDYVSNNEDLVKHGIGEGYYHPYTTVKDIVTTVSTIMQELKENDDLADSGLIEANRKGIVDAFAVKSHHDERKERFNQFNMGIKNSLDIYGMGITSISRKEIDWFKDLLRKGVNINLCMINPKLLYAQSCKSCLKGTDCDLLSAFNFQIAEQHFNDYSAKTDYYSAVQESYNNLKRLIAKIKKDTTLKSGKITLRTINSFLPMSINIKEKNEDNAKILMEYGVPFTANKTIIEITKSSSRTAELFTNLVQFYDLVIEKSKEVDSWESR